MKHFIKMVGVLGILGAVYLAPSVKVSAKECTAWVLDSSFTNCENGLKIYYRTLSRSCITEGGTYVVTEYNRDNYVIGTC